MKLYEISNEIKRLIDDSVDPETGELLPEASDQLDKLHTNKLEKLSDVVLFIKNEDSFADAIDAEIKKLQSKKKTVQSRVNYLKEYIKRNIVEGEKIEQPNFILSWGKSESIETDPIMDLEEMHKKNPVLVKKNISYSVDKIEAKKLYKETGILPEGFKLITKQNLQIK